MRSMTRLEEDLNIHQKLDDEPNDVGGLTAQELKARFDRAGLVIQRYLNDIHLPQVENALGENLEELKEYVDRRVVAVGAGDMASAVYDTRGRRRDVYDYAREVARETLGDAARFGYVCAGKAVGRARQGERVRVQLGEYVDPRGLWDAEKRVLTVPEGARAMLMSAQVKWARESFGECAVEVRVNGEKAVEVRGPENSTGNYVWETVLLPVEVSGGDEVAVELSAQAANGNTAEVKCCYLKAEIMV